jgi:hypothetical protein
VRIHKHVDREKEPSDSLEGLFQAHIDWLLFELKPLPLFMGEAGSESLYGRSPEQALGTDAERPGAARFPHVSQSTPA